MTHDEEFKSMMKAFLIKTAEASLEKAFTKMLASVKESGSGILTEMFSSLSEEERCHILEETWNKSLSNAKIPPLAHNRQKKTYTLEELLSLDEDSPQASASPATVYSHSFHERAEQSKLYRWGYSVSKESGLSTKQRQDLLRHLILTNKLSKGYIINFLEHLIEINGKKESNNNAVAKWTADLNFVRNLT